MPLETVTYDQPIEWSTILVSGPQAQEFLQGQLTQDVRDIGENTVDALVLTPDSVVVTSCRVSRFDDRFELVVERPRADAARARLARFKLRTNCVIEVTEGGVGPYESVGGRIDAGRPGAPEFARELTPHSFGHSFVERTVSFTKGCFTGQELVGRLDARDANVPWRLARVRGRDLATIEDVVRGVGPEGPQGVTSVVARGGEVIGLAIVHRRLAEQGSADPDVVVVEVT